MRLGLSAVVVLVALAGCRPTVGTACDEAAARTVVYSASGLPAYAGQSMLVNSCAGGGTHCHSSTAADRFGAPFGMNFDPVLTDVYADQASAARHLYEAQAMSNRFYDDIFAEVASGAMPPGAVGDAVFPTMDGYAYANGDAVPSVRSADGREILRNWLACGSPVVQATIAPAVATCASDLECPSRRCAGGTCEDVGAIEPARAIGSAWSEVYASVLGPRCAVSVCHGARGASVSGMLDMSTPELAYAQLVDHDASSAACGSRVVRGEPDRSLLVAKVEGTQDPHACGHRMPSLGASLTSAQIAAVRAWITAGAAP